MFCGGWIPPKKAVRDESRVIVGDHKAPLTAVLEVTCAYKLARVICILRGWPPDGLAGA